MTCCCSGSHFLCKVNAYAKAGSCRKREKAAKSPAHLLLPNPTAQYTRPRPEQAGGGGELEGGRCKRDRVLVSQFSGGQTETSPWSCPGLRIPSNEGTGSVPRILAIERSKPAAYTVHQPTTGRHNQGQLWLQSTVWKTHCLRLQEESGGSEAKGSWLR